MLHRTRWKWDDKFANLENITFRKSCSTSASDQEVSVLEDRAQCMRINPVVESNILKFMESLACILIERSKKDNPLHVDVLTSIYNGIEDIF